MKNFFSLWHCSLSYWTHFTEDGQCLFYLKIKVKTRNTKKQKPRKSTSTKKYFEFNENSFWAFDWFDIKRNHIRLHKFDERIWWKIVAKNFQPIKELTFLFEKLVQHDPRKWKLNWRYIQLWSLELGMKMGKREMSFANSALQMVSRSKQTHIIHATYYAKKHARTCFLRRRCCCLRTSNSLIFLPFLFFALICSYCSIHTNICSRSTLAISRFPLLEHNRKREQKPIRKVIWDTIYSMTIQNIQRASPSLRHDESPMARRSKPKHTKNKHFPKLRTNSIMVTMRWLSSWLWLGFLNQHKKTNEESQNDGGAQREWESKKKRRKQLA